jgi:hypothetical protein
LRGSIADEVRLIELVTLGLESRSEIKTGDFERRVGVGWNMKEVAAKVPLQ